MPAVNDRSWWIERSALDIKMTGELGHRPTERPIHLAALRELRLRRDGERRRERGEDFFEAQIAAERIPLRIKLQLAVHDAAGNLRGDFQLLERQIFLARPGVDHR